MDIFEELFCLSQEISVKITLKYIMMSQEIVCVNLFNIISIQVVVAQ